MRFINKQPEWYGYILNRSSEVANAIDFTFDSRVSLTDFITQILFCCFKEVTAMKLQRMSISQYIGDDECEAQSKLAQRMREIALDRNERDLMRWGMSKANPYADMLKKLPPQEQGKFSGYQLSELDFKALVNSARNTGLPIVALLKDGMITDSKRANRERIKDAYMDWGEYLKEQAEEEDSRHWLCNLFDVSSLETSLCATFLYQVACYMEDNNLKTAPEAICALAGVCSIHMPEGTIRIQSRFLMKRESLIPFVFQEEEVVVKEYLTKLLILHWRMMREVRENSKVYEEIEKLPEKKKVDYLKKWYNIMDVSFDGDRFSPPFTKKLREAARTITDPQLYQNKKAKAVPRSE